MLEALGPEVWITSLALACSLGWLLGDRSSIRQITWGDGENDHPNTGTSSSPNERAPEIRGVQEEFFTLTIRLPAMSLREMLQGAEQDQAASSPSMGRNARKEMFSDMPTLAELHASTDAIRLDSRLWDAPDLSEQIDAFIDELDAGTRQTLSEYRASIAALQSTQDKRRPRD